MNLYHFFPLVLDNTQLTAFKGCPTKWFYNHCLHLAEEKSVHLHFGGAYARGLEVARTRFYLEGATEAEAVDAGAQAIIDFWGDPDDFARLTKNLTACVQLLELYFMQFPMSTDIYRPVLLDLEGREEVGVEFDFMDTLNFRHPVIDSELFFTGRVDMLTNSPNYDTKSVMVFDDKTTGGYITPFLRESWRTRAQFSGYCKGLRNAGIKARGAVISLASITKSGVAFERLETVRSPYQLEIWEKSRDTTVKQMLEYYSIMVAEKKLNPKSTVPQCSPSSNLSEHCLSFFRNCWYTEACVNATGESMRFMGAKQNIWLPHEARRGNLQALMEELEMDLEDNIWTVAQEAQNLDW